MIIWKQLNLRLNTYAAPKSFCFLQALTPRQGGGLAQNIPLPEHAHKRTHANAVSLSRHVKKYVNNCIYKHVSINHLIYRIAPRPATPSEGQMYAKAICLVSMAYSLLNFPRIVNSTLALNSYAYECFSLWESFSFHNTLVWEAGLHVKSGTFVFPCLVFYSLFGPFFCLAIVHSLYLSSFSCFLPLLDLPLLTFLSPPFLSSLLRPLSPLYPFPLLSPSLPVNLLHFPPGAPSLRPWCSWHRGTAAAAFMPTNNAGRRPQTSPPPDKFNCRGNPGYRIWHVWPRRFPHAPRVMLRYRV